ncbi:cytochrome P450 [Sphaerisporangium sp. NBC_01403]|uniref:cytochrome P450 n=1 Tax=Sphaerisporangium sp. NBC_01403 TaxID=2903599 RepID=UPI003249DAE2
MSVATGTRQATAVPIHRILPDVVRDPVNALAELGRRARGDVVLLRAGAFRLYLVTHPDHVQHVLRGNSTNYVREGMFWRPLQRLLGNGILDEGPAWESSRKILQPLFTARYIATIAEELAKTIDEQVGELEEHARTGRSIDAAEEIGRITNQAVIRVLFGDKISRQDGERLAPAFERAATSIGFRLLMPFLPYSVRVPGDRAFMNAVKKIDEVVFPLIRSARKHPDDGFDVISALCRARGRNGEQITDQQIRDDLVSVFGAASETTAMALTWLWPLLDANPQPAARLYAEIDRVVGAGPALPSHVPELRYTKMVLQELLRLYPPGWILPRMARRSDDVGGFLIKAGSQVLISPYATHRLDEIWERPLHFDPERFSPDSPERRHRYAYFPFGGGPHACLGQHLFHVEAPLVLAALLSRFRPVLRNRGPFKPAPAASIRPNPKIELGLTPVQHAGEGRR